MVLKSIEDLLAEVRVAADFARKKIANSIDGLLYTRVINGTVRYYKRPTGETSIEYLGKDCQETIKALEEKNYYSKLLENATEEEKVLLNVQKKLNMMPDYNSVFLSIPKEKRHLIAPYVCSFEETKEDIVRLFSKKYVKEELKLITQNGEHVRSKSEVILADRFKAAGVPYYYEDPLYFADESNAKEDITPCLYWHPDFRVQNVKTGKQYYWEHFGMLDNSEYCSFCQSKLEIYAQHGYFPGENLIITTESSGHGLNLEYVDSLIERYLK